MKNTFVDSTIETAARWYARLLSADCTHADREEFERWRARDPSHGAAFRAAQQLADTVSQAAIVDRRLKELADEAFAAELRAEAVGLPAARGPHSRRRRRSAVLHFTRAITPPRD
jgi:ferric-dicitrate binding protein FerR (iron transport regulator)